MLRLSLGRYSLLLLNMGMVAVLAMSAAHWTWVFFAPETMASVAGGGGPVQPVATILQARLFQSAGDSAASEQVTLEAVFADEPSHAGYAIVTLNGKTQTVASGGFLAPDLMLQGVFPHHIVLMQHGAPMVVRLHETLAEVPVVPGLPVALPSGLSTSDEPANASSAMMHLQAPHRVRHVP